jgi:hypothetical protein
VSWKLSLGVGFRAVWHSAVMALHAQVDHLGEFGQWSQSALVGCVDVVAS